jgi:hypothetical protein
MSQWSISQSSMQTFTQKMLMNNHTFQQTKNVSWDSTFKRLHILALNQNKLIFKLSDPT